MSVQEVVPYSKALGNGVSKQFPLGFPCDKKESLKVKINEIEVSTEHWSLNQNTVIFNTAPETNVLIQFERSTKAMRTTDYATYNDSLRGDVLNYDFDRIWWKLQELGLSDWLLGLRIDKEIRDRIAADIYNYTLVTKETNYKINELKEYLEALVNNLAGGDFLPILDKYIQTWSGRTQQEENKAFITTVDNYSDLDDLVAEDGRAVYLSTPSIAGQFKYVENSLKTPDGGSVIQDKKNRVWERVGFVHLQPSWFGANGDAITDDTLYFKHIESSFSTAMVDLGGKTYAVSVEPKLKFYFNGKFKLGSQVVDKSIVLKNELRKLSNNSQYTSIKHIRNPNYNFAYEFIHLNITPEQLNLRGMHIEGTVNNLARKSPTEMAELLRVPIILNGAAFQNTSGDGNWDQDILMPYGIFIEDGVIYSDWDTSLSLSRNQACCLVDGQLKRYYREQTSASEMVLDGAVWGMSWGAFCVYDGVVPPDWTTSSVYGGGTSLSARSVICQMHDNSFAFIQIEGVSGISGATPPQIAEIAMHHNVKHAFIYEGGGSTQINWGGVAALPSSDVSKVRTLPSCFAISVPAVTPYESGLVAIPTTNPTSPVNSVAPTLSLRQTGSTVALNFNIQGFASGELAYIPKRYLDKPEFIRSVLTGGVNGSLISVTSAPSGRFAISLTPGGTTIPATVVGAMRWLIN